MPSSLLVMQYNDGACIYWFRPVIFSKIQIVKVITNKVYSLKTDRNKNVIETTYKYSETKLL